jgi:hypothetical protein
MRDGADGSVSAVWAAGFAGERSPESSFTRRRDGAAARERALGVGSPGWPWEALEDLKAQEVRLYALGWGDYLTVEVRERLELLHERRLRLEARLDAF